MSSNDLGTRDEALTAEQCDYFAADGRTTICHATSSARNPVVLIKVAEQACVNAHADHAGDYIAVDGDCGPDACLPATAPCDDTLGCCDGLTCSDGVCADFDACTTDPCGDNETCTDLPFSADDGVGYTCSLAVPPGAHGIVVGDFSLPAGSGFAGMHYDHESYVLTGIDNGGVGDTGTIRPCNLDRGFCYEATLACTAVVPEADGVRATVGFVIPDTEVTRAYGIAGVQVVLQTYDGNDGHDYGEYVASNQGLPFAVNAMDCHLSGAFADRALTGALEALAADTPSR